jgi:hypothetical protein
VGYLSVMPSHMGAKVDVLAYPLHQPTTPIPLKGRQFTWSNMQKEPLLEQLDWCFTPLNWISNYPNTLMLPLARTTSDHTPCVVHISTEIPKGNVFRFENFWVQRQGLCDLVKLVWEYELRATTTASIITTKFKLL